MSICLYRLVRAEYVFSLSERQDTRERPEASRQSGPLAKGTSGPETLIQGYVPQEGTGTWSYVSESGFRGRKRIKKARRGVG